MDLTLGVRLRLGVSSCLLGQPVRYDSGHKHDHWVADRLGRLVDWVPVCPEAEAGLGVPRERIRLEATADGATAVLGLDSLADYTTRLDTWSQTRLDALGLAAFDGYLFKERSPSCGLEGVAVYEGEREAGRAPGHFAASVLAREPHLPVCTEAEFQVPENRRHFLEGAQTRARWRALVHALPHDRENREAAVAAWLERHELLLLCREEEVPAPGDCARDLAALSAVGRVLAAGMARRPSLQGHVHALAAVHDRLVGVSVHERVGLALLVRDLEAGALDVEVPRQFARALVLRTRADHLRRQHYLDPVPVNAR